MKFGLKIGNLKVSEAVLENVEFEFDGSYLELKDAATTFLSQIQLQTIPSNGVVNDKIIEKKQEKQTDKSLEEKYNITKDQAEKLGESLNQLGISEEVLLKLAEDFKKGGNR
ncbi:MAG: hypothetical protein ACRC5S_03370 [Cetobacterium sp.]